MKADVKRGDDAYVTAFSEHPGTLCLTYMELLDYNVEREITNLDHAKATKAKDHVLNS